MKKCERGDKINFFFFFKSNKPIFLNLTDRISNPIRMAIKVGRVPISKTHMLTKLAWRGFRKFISRLLSYFSVGIAPIICDMQKKN